MSMACQQTRDQVLVALTGAVQSSCHIPQLLSLMVEYAVDMDFLRVKEWMDNWYESTSVPLSRVLRELTCSNHCQRSLGHERKAVWSGSPINMDQYIICNACYVGANVYIPATCCHLLINTRAGWKRDIFYNQSCCNYHAQLANNRRAVDVSIDSLQSIDVKTRVVYKDRAVMCVMPVELTLPPSLSSTAVYASPWFAKRQNPWSRVAWMDGRYVDSMYANNRLISSAAFGNVYEWMPFDHDDTGKFFALVNCNEQSPMFKRVATALLDGSDLAVDLTQFDIETYMQKKHAFGSTSDGLPCCDCPGYGLRRFKHQTLCDPCYDQISDKSKWHIASFIEFYRCRQQLPTRLT